MLEQASQAAGGCVPAAPVGLHAHGDHIPARSGLTQVLWQDRRSIQRRGTYLFLLFRSSSLLDVLTISQELYKFVAPDALRLVPESKNFITQSYVVEAATSKGRDRHWFVLSSLFPESLVVRPASLTCRGGTGCSSSPRTRSW
jgi:hypothetical protein